MRIKFEYIKLLVPFSIFSMGFLIRELSLFCLFINFDWYVNRDFRGQKIYKGFPKKRCGPWFFQNNVDKKINGLKKVCVDKVFS